MASRTAARESRACVNVKGRGEELRARPQDLLEGPSLRQFVNQLVQVADIKHHGIRNLGEFHATNRTGDERGVRIDASTFVEVLQRATLSQKLTKLFVGKTRQPQNDLIKLVDGSTFTFHLADVCRVDVGKWKREQIAHPRIIESPPSKSYPDINEAIGDEEVDMTEHPEITSALHRAGALTPQVLLSKRTVLVIHAVSQG